MQRLIPALALTAFIHVGALAEESATATDETTEDPSAATSEAATRVATADAPKTLSGMSILGNEEAPKALVIIPWKSSELGDQVEFSNALDASPTPVDKEVFRRQLDFHAIRVNPEEQDSQ